MKNIINEQVKPNMWPLLLIQNVVLLKHILENSIKSAHCLLFISSLGCEAKFSIKTQELTPKGVQAHMKNYVNYKNQQLQYMKHYARDHKLNIQN